jgi:polyisoprenoid-binding protein YceI
VTLALDVNGFTKDPYGNTRAGFSATGEIDRTDFGITTKRTFRNLGLAGWCDDPGP